LAQEDEARERVRAAERRAAAAQQRSLDKKIQALNGKRVHYALVRVEHIQTLACHGPVDASGHE
jgi:hypothetical protein